MGQLPPRFRLEDDVALRRRVANLLRVQRGRRPRALLALRAGSGMPSRRLRALERAEASASPAELATLAEVYGFALADLEPERTALEIDAGAAKITTAGVEARFDPEDEDSLLVEYLRLVRALRREPHEPTIPLRRRDIESLAGYLRTDGTVVIDRLGALMGSTVQQRRVATVAFAAGATIIILGAGAAAVAPDDAPQEFGGDAEGPSSEFVEAVSLGGAWGAPAPDGLSGSDAAADELLAAGGGLDDGARSDGSADVTGGGSGAGAQDETLSRFGDQGDAADADAGAAPAPGDDAHADDADDADDADEGGAGPGDGDGSGGGEGPDGGDGGPDGGDEGPDGGDGRPGDDEQGAGDSEGSGGGAGPGGEGGSDAEEGSDDGDLDEAPDTDEGPDDGDDNDADGGPAGGGEDSGEEQGPEDGEGPDDDVAAEPLERMTLQVIPDGTGGLQAVIDNPNDLPLAYTLRINNRLINWSPEPVTAPAGRTIVALPFANGSGTSYWEDGPATVALVWSVPDEDRNYGTSVTADWPADDDGDDDPNDGDPEQDPDLTEAFKIDDGRYVYELHNGNRDAGRQLFAGEGDLITDGSLSLRNATFENNGGGPGEGWAITYGTPEANDRIGTGYTLQIDPGFRDGEFVLRTWDESGAHDWRRTPQHSPFPEGFDPAQPSHVTASVANGFISLYVDGEQHLHYEMGTSEQDDARLGEDGGVFGIRAWGGGPRVEFEQPALEVDPGVDEAPDVDDDPSPAETAEAGDAVDGGGGDDTDEGGDADDAGAGDGTEEAGGAGDGEQGNDGGAGDEAAGDDADDGGASDGSDDAEDSDDVGEDDGEGDDPDDDAGVDADDDEDDDEDAGHEVSEES